VLFILDPEVHGIGHDELRLVYLCKQLLLESRVRIGRKMNLLSANTLGTTGGFSASTLSSTPSVFASFIAP